MYCYCLNCNNNINLTNSRVYLYCSIKCGNIYRNKKYQLTEKRKISLNKYNNSIKGKATKNKYNKTILAKISKFKYDKSNKGKITRRLRDKIRYKKTKLCTPKWVNYKTLKEIYLNRPSNYHVDHIIPIKHDYICGLHVPWNLQYLPKQINLQKGNKYDI